MRRTIVSPWLSPALFLALVAACSSGGTGGTGPTGTIALSLNPTGATVVQGGSTTLTGTLTRGDGFTGTVTFAVEDAPSTVTATVANIQTVGTATTATVTILVGASTAPGPYTMTVRGKATGLADAPAQFQLTVTQTPDFALSVNPTSASLVQGANRNDIVVTLARTNFTDPVTLSLAAGTSAIPAGVTASFAPAAPGGMTSTMTLMVGVASPAGSYNLNISGTGAPGTRSTPFTLTIIVPGSFTLAVAPPGALSLQQGTNDNSKAVSITRINYAGNITLTAEGLPNGVTAAFAGNPVSGNSSVMTLTATAGAVIGGPVTVTIRGTGPASLVAQGAAASLEATATFTLTVIAPGSFTLGLTPVCGVGISLTQNSLDDSRIVTITRTNFPLNVALSVDNLPAGFTASFAANPTAANGSVLTLTADGTVAPATYNLTIRGTGPGTQATTSLAVSVTQGRAPEPNVLDYTFPGGDFEGWTPGSACASLSFPDWGFAFPQGGFIGLDGTGNPGSPNSWFSKLITLPAKATTLEFDAGGLGATGSDARLNIRILDNGVSSSAFDQIITGAPPAGPTFRTRTADISPWAGKTVRIFFEQDANGFNGVFPGANEQVYLDNIHIRTSLSGATYAFRKPITVATGSAAAPAGYSVALQFDHAAMVTAGKSLASGDDIRIVYSNGSTPVEQHRVLDAGSSWNSATTRIWFKTVTPIATSEADNNYFIYYGSPGATNPPANRSSVFLFSDDFETGNFVNWIKIGAQSWVINSTQTHGGTKALMYPTEADAGSDIVVNPGLNIADVYFESWWYISNVSSAWSVSEIIRTRALPNDPDQKYHAGLCACSTASLGWNLGKRFNDVYSDLVPSSGTPLANTWTRVGVAMHGGTLRNFINNALFLSVAGQNEIASGNVGLHKFVVPPGASWWIDDVIARRYVFPEPGSTLGAEQGGPFSVSWTTGH